MDTLEQLVGVVSKEVAFEIGQAINTFACGCWDEEDLHAKIAELSGGDVAHILENNGCHILQLSKHNMHITTIVVSEQDPMIP